MTFTNHHQHGDALRDLIQSLWGTRRFSFYVSSLRTLADEYLLDSPTASGCQLVDPALKGQAASCCTQSQFAGIYALHGLATGGDGLEVAEALMLNVAARQHPGGGFAIPYNRPPKAEQLIDIAEIGAASDSLYLLSLCDSKHPAANVLIAGADSVFSHAAAEAPGAFYKNHTAKHIDVFNGDVYAALTLARAYSLTRDGKYADAVAAVVERLLGTLQQSKNEAWWPYAEDWQGHVVLGNSVAYQATIVCFGRQLLLYLDKELAERWGRALDNALTTVIKHMGYGPSENNEAPVWSRDWENVWEIYLALSDAKPFSRADRYLSNRLERLDIALTDGRGMAWTPTATHVQDRNALTSAFRKSATFGGVLVSWVLTRASIGELKSDQSRRLDLFDLP